MFKIAKHQNKKIYKKVSTIPKQRANTTSKVCLKNMCLNYFNISQVIVQSYHVHCLSEDVVQCPNPN